MNDDPATSATPALTPDIEPKVEALAPAGDAPVSEPAPEGPAVEAPEAEASVEQETGPEAASEPELEPAPPPELAEPEVVAQNLASVDEPEVIVPVEEHSEAVPETEPEEPAPKAKRTRKKAAPKETETDADETPEAEPDAVLTSTDAPAEPPASSKKWYAIKVQSGREDTIKAAILRKVAIEGLEEFLGRIEIPFEEVIEKKQVKVKDKKTGEYSYQEKKVTRKKKKFHGYIFAELEFNDRILYLFRETSGVGDFLNMRGKPPIPEPMPEHEVQSMLTGVAAKDRGKGGKVKVKLDFEKGDKVKIRDGSFANQEGEVKSITEPKDPTDSPKVKVELTFWGRPLEVELDYWQVDKA